MDTALIVELLAEKERADRDTNKRALRAFGIAFAAFALYPFLFGIVQGGAILLVFLGWPIAIIASIIHVAKTVHSTQHERICKQAELVQRLLEDGYAFRCNDSSDAVHPSLLLRDREIVKNFRVTTESGEYGLLLYKDEVGDKEKLNFRWYTTATLQQRITGTTYLVAETDFSHILFKQFNTETTLLEWGRFEDLLHVATTDETEARYVLAPDVMEKIYTAWSGHPNFLCRVRFSQNTLSAVTGLKKLGKRKTLLDGDLPQQLIEAFVLLRSLVAAIPHV